MPTRIQSCHRVVAYLALALAMAPAFLSHAGEPARRMTSWALLGPFPYQEDGYTEAVVPGEAALRPALGEPVAGRTWQYFDDRFYCRNQDDYNDLYTYFMEGREGGPGGGAPRQVAYCGAYVWSPRNQEALLWFSANDRGKVWLNGEPALTQPETLQAMRDTRSEPVALRQGWNRVLAKVVNNRRIWGFYASFTDREGQILEGLEYSVDDPAGAKGLEVVTPAMPTGYNNQPYVWLDVRNPDGRFPWDNPSASPYRFMARGGTPPYTWAVDGLPEGLTFDAAEGEIRGRTKEVGSHALTVTVTDGTSTASRPLVLEIAPRPTERWWESGSRVGGLRHHGIASDTFWAFDHVEEQIEYMTRMGYAWQAYTYYSAWILEDDGAIRIRDDADMLRYRDALRDAGIRFAMYMSFKDFQELAPDYKAHAENMHEALEKLMRKHRPVFWFMDEMYGRHFRQEDHETVEFDALYSLVRTLDPDCLITVNGDIRARDYECGDLDILQVHGSYKVDSNWGHWPPHPLLGNNPKFMPVDSWKLPYRGYMDPAEWCRTIVTMLAEPGNLEAPRTIDIDPSPFLEEDYNTVELLRGIGDWLEPRKESILGTMPLPLPPADWGYAVRQPATGDLYLHILENPFGKRGLFERRFIDLRPIESTIGSVSLFPAGDPVPFTQQDSHVAIDVRHIRRNSVVTIIRLQVKQ